MYWNLSNDAFIYGVWPDSADIDPSILAVLMATANSLCLAYGPVLSEGAVVPESYKLAEVITARDIWSKMGGGNRESFGPDGLEIPVAPLVWLARDLLRPKTNPISRLR